MTECPDCGSDHDTAACGATGAQTACDCCNAVERGPEYVTCSLCGMVHTGSHHCG